MKVLWKKHRMNVVSIINPGVGNTWTRKLGDSFLKETIHNYYYVDKNGNGNYIDKDAVLEDGDISLYDKSTFKQMALTNQLDGLE